ncbi:hypothetical protein Sru01_61220 [Sphaerisporangium rufum]|uniref:Histidine kinase/HSP90-like ATPase domain-containing protein n=1 Tax=Sphaerisporangium rufum TaxID=1381558 RepID=A0A919RBX8_9ACTN|nr:hypothetical protein Sru01_61220 [Sphaerisporangium rufum]
MCHDPYAARTARGFAAKTLHGWGMADLLDDAEPVVGELVINALQHGLAAPVPALFTVRDPVRVILALTDDLLICVVTDPVGAVPVPREPGADAEGGRGLQLVAGISDRWGWTPLGPGGKAVWAGFRLPDGPPGPPRHLEVCR